MKFKRMFLLGALLCVFVPSAKAFNTAGKFGMGIRFWGTPLITFSTVKLDITNIIGFEPFIGYYQTKTNYEYGDYKITANIYSLTANLNFIRCERSNFFVKFGGGYAATSIFYPTSTGETYASNLQFTILLYGLGIEHFVNDNFAVNVGAVLGLQAGYWSGTDEKGDMIYSSITAFNNLLVDFSLVWYLK